MRLHHLVATAFGPFAGTVEVDFDELSAGGLFLLTGSTGSGKTSVLDAVCFALYGQVPGDRAGAKHLRSDHAAPQAVPEVRLRFSVGDRQFTFARSPAWSRPKLRGNGETRVQAHVVIDELKDGSWVTLTNRLDDAGLLVTDLLGMTCTQFNQVAMLPQGRFQAFLRATSAERHAVLQQLFRTDRFERVERWLVDRRTAARRASEATAVEVVEVVNRLREAAAGSLEQAPDDRLGDGDLLAAVEAGRVQDWVASLRTTTRADAAAAAELSAKADVVLAGAAADLAHARRAQEYHARGTRALEDLERLAARADELATSAARLGEHHRAAPLAGLVTSLETAGGATATARTGWERHRAELSHHLPLDEQDSGELSVALDAARSALTLTTAFTPRAAARVEAADRLSTGHHQLQALETRVAEVDVIITEQPAVIADAVAAVHEARAAAARLPVVAAAVATCEEQVQAARRAEVVSLELVAARTDVLAAIDAAQAAKEHYLDVREARINGMAGELAGQLASGCSCPVCGSANHPAPARAEARGIGRTEEDDARRLSEDAAFELQARKVGLAALEGELVALDAQLGQAERGLLGMRLQDARDEAERLEPLVAALDVLVAREQDCRARLQAAEAERAQALLDRARVNADHDQTLALLDEIDREWAALMAVSGVTDEDPEADLAQLIACRAARVDALAAATAAADALDRAHAQEEVARLAVARGAEHAGFPDVATAISALLPEPVVAQLREELREAELLERAAVLTLADPAVAAAQVEPDLERLGTEHEAAASAARTAVSARDATAARSQRVEELALELASRLDAWSPLRAEHRTVAALAALVEGKSVDNPLRMRLAAYVLAERLRQVVAAANERLARMTDQRYSLAHTDDRGYGEQRGGLSLLVRDDWNGVQRDPATLSGGETFVVSLALALGLADTVAHEAGGADIDTLFIDEGFGSLDADTLEDVMDTLDSLRDGGRVVGLVSHVPELRSRITTQLEVTKGRSGSTVRTAFTGT